MSKMYRVRIVNYDKETGGYRLGAKAWVNDSRVEDINIAHALRQKKDLAKSNAAYKFVVEEWTRGMP